ncbi:MAG: iron-sulfur cluster insertion protein ErpA [Candidatus Latescibacterota bacterium]|nr:iron-sulfur cluster insertion protein ErpA [Candidatus Latescibacterota bacterium]
MITVTDAAAQKIKTLISENDKKLEGLRMAVKGGGCSGFQYDLEFADNCDDLDHVFEAAGVKIFVDMKSSLYLNGVTLDYQDGLMGAGFKIENPNARTTCGCGESFSA